LFVPVVDTYQNPLMPTTPQRAGKWIKSGKATPFWKNGVFCVRLNVGPSSDYKQEIVVGVDPGSKKEGFTVKSESHTYLNIQADAHHKVGWCLAYHTLGGKDTIDNINVMCISPIPIVRRQLHRQNSQTDGKRPRYGGTTWEGLVKNTLVRHLRYGFTRIAGFGKKGISLYSLEGKRLCQNAKPSDFKVLTRLNFNYKSGIFSHS
jgi:hypothetical protein